MEGSLCSEQRQHGDIRGGPNVAIISRLLNDSLSSSDGRIITVANWKGCSSGRGLLTFTDAGCAWRD